MRTGAQFFHGAKRCDIAFIDDNGPVGNQVGAGQLVSNHNDGHVKRPFQLHDQLIETGGNNRVETSGRLVKEQYLRIHGKGAGDTRTLLHASAQFRRHEILKACQPHLIEFQPDDNLDRRLLKLGVFAQRERDMSPPIGNRREPSPGKTCQSSFESDPFPSSNCGNVFAL